MSETAACLDSALQRIAGAQCPLCGLTGLTIGERDGVPLRNCSGCVTAAHRVDDGEHTPREWRTADRPHAPVLLAWAWSSEAEYEAFYTDGERYHVEEAHAIGRESFWQRDSEYLGADAARLLWLQSTLRLPPGARLLDVGAGTGAFASLARAMHQFDALGVEPNLAMVAQGQCLGRPVTKGDWRTAPACPAAPTQTLIQQASLYTADIQGDKADGWDVITLIDVLEHLTQPVACLDRLRNLLTPTGSLYVEMPEWDGDLRENHHVKPRQHVCLYAPGAAEAMYRNRGLRVVAMQRPEPGGARLRKMAHLLKKAW